MEAFADEQPSLVSLVRATRRSVVVPLGSENQLPLGLRVADEEQEPSLVLTGEVSDSG